MRKPLSILDYADRINLHEQFSFEPTNKYSKEELLDHIFKVINETKKPSLDYSAKRRLLHAHLNTLPAHSLNDESIKYLDELLQLELQEKNLTSAETIIAQSNYSIKQTQLAIWKGDITTLQLDAVVNAANNQLMGCWQPLHACIDNAIHSAAGVQLRDDCCIIMEKQGFAETTGTAKITRAYNLPSNFVLHTVGPIVQGHVTEQSKNDLKNVYESCLNLCNEIPAIKSIAFCCISTGVFGYPSDQAAALAFETVTNWLNEHENTLDLVVFNVFSDNDKILYNTLIQE